MRILSLGSRLRSCTFCNSKQGSVPDAHVGARKLVNINAFGGLWDQLGALVFQLLRSGI